MGRPARSVVDSDRRHKSLWDVNSPQPARIRHVNQGVVGGVHCRRWAVDACGLDQPDAGGPDPFNSTGQQSRAGDQPEQ